MTAETFHNPDRFMADFRQIISLGRKRIGILAGAGLPVSMLVNATKDALDPKGQPLILDVSRLTTEVIDSFAGTELLALKAVRDECGKDANIESVLSRIRLLERAIGKVPVHNLNAEAYKELGQKICDRIGDHVKVKLPAEKNSYTELVSWIGGTPRQYPLEVFTTNYDLLFEEAFERAKIPYFDGFSGGHNPFFDPVTVAGDDLPSRWVRLWKLHGSLGWAAENKTVIRKGGTDATQLIYPDHLKYELIQKQPYTALLDRLRQFLAIPDTLLLAIGFSFSDSHISTVLEEGLAFNSNTAVFAFQYKTIANEGAASAIAQMRPNFSVYAEDAAVICGVQGPWKVGELPDKNWQEIRNSFWSSRTPGIDPVFTLGDFGQFARFCATAQSPDVHNAILPSPSFGTGATPVPPAARP